MAASAMSLPGISDAEWSATANSVARATASSAAPIWRGYEASAEDPKLHEGLEWFAASADWQIQWL